MRSRTTRLRAAEVAFGDEAKERRGLREGLPDGMTRQFGLVSQDTGPDPGALTPAGYPRLAEPAK